MKNKEFYYSNIVIFGNHNTELLSGFLSSGVFAYIGVVDYDKTVNQEGFVLITNLLEFADFLSNHRKIHYAVLNDTTTRYYFYLSECGADTITICGIDSHRDLKLPGYRIIQEVNSTGQNIGVFRRKKDDYQQM